MAWKPKAVLQLDVKGNVLQHYERIGLASEATLVAKNGIEKCLYMGQKTAGGYCWKFEEDYLKEQEEKKKEQEDNG